MGTPLAPLASKQKTVVELGRFVQQELPDLYGDVTDHAKLGRFWKQEHPGIYDDILNVEPQVIDPSAAAPVAEAVLPATTPAAPPFPSLQDVQQQAMRERALPIPVEGAQLQVEPPPPPADPSDPSTAIINPLLGETPEIRRQLTVTGRETQTGRVRDFFRAYVGANPQGQNFVNRIDFSRLLPTGKEASGMDDTTQVGVAALRGMSHFASGFTTPEAVALIGGTAGLGALASGATTAVSTVVANLGLTGMSGAFAIEMFKQTPEQVRAIGAAVERGDMPAAVEMGTQLALTAGAGAGMAVGAGRAGARAMRPVISKVKQRGVEAKTLSPAELGKRGRTKAAEAERLAEELELGPEQVGKPGAMTTRRKLAIQKQEAEAAAKQPGLSPVRATLSNEQLTRIFGKGVAKTLDGKPVTVRPSGRGSRPGVTEVTLYEVVDPKGKVVYSGDATMVRGRLQVGKTPTGAEVLPTRPAIKAPAPVKTPAAKEAASIVEGLRKEAAKTPAPKPVAAPKPAPKAKTPTVKVAVAPIATKDVAKKTTKKPQVDIAPAPSFKVKRKAIKGPMELEVQQDVADRLYGGQTRVSIEIDEDGSIQATPVGGGEERWIAFAGDTVISGYRIPPRKAVQEAPAEKKVAEPKAEPERPVSPEPAPVAAVEEVAPAEKPSHIPQEAEMGDRGWKIKLSDIDVEPERFQFRSDLIGPTGVADDRLKNVKKWDSEKERTILLWVDPEDGRAKLIDGHHRLDLARRLGVDEIQPQFISWEKAPTYQKARLRGVVSNLREGNVNAIDVARYMLDTGVANVERLEEGGIATTKKVFRDGQALSRLDAAVFQDIVRGRLREWYGVVAGQASGEAVDQKQIVKVLQEREDRDHPGEPVDAKLAMRIANHVARADTTTASQKTLFGIIETQASLSEQEAEIAEHISKQLGREKKLFSTVSSSVSAGTLEATGNVLKREENLARAKQLKQGKEIFEKLSGKAGPIDQIIKKHAKSLAEGEGQNAATIRREALQEVVAELGESIPGRAPKGRQGARRADGPSEQATVALAESGQVTLYSGIPAVKEIIDIVVRKTVSDLGILKKQALQETSTAEGWWKETHKEPSFLFWGLHLPAYIADTVPAFKPIFELAREGHHKAVEYIAEFMDLSSDYWKLSSGQARLLNERLIDADRKGVPQIEEDGLESGTLNAFRGFRRAMDHAFRLMEDLTVDLATQGKVTSAAKIRKKKDLHDALIEGGMSEAQANKRAGLVWETLEKFRETRRTGYVPHSRLGRFHYGLKIAETGESIFYGSESLYRTAANKMRKLRSEHAAKLKSGEYEFMNKGKGEEGEEKHEGRPWKKYQQSFGELINEFMDSQLLKELSPELAQEVRNEIEPLLARTGAKAKFLSRKNIPGYDTDIHRVAADYFLMVGHFVARTRMFRNMRDKMPRESKSKPQLPKYAKDYVRYLARPDNSLAWLRSLMFHYHLGFLNPKAAGFNLTQVPLVTFPWLLQYAKAPDVVKELTRAYADLKTPTPDNPMGRGKIEYARLPEDVREAAIASLHHGTLAAQYARELGGIQKRGISRTGVRAKLGTLADFGEEASAFLFQGAEHVNRLVTFIAAYRLAKKSLPKGFQDASEFAESVVDNTQFQYAKYNRPKFSWPKRFNILAMFKTFAIAHYEVMLRLALGTGAGGDGPPDPEREERNRIALAAFSWMIVASAGVYGLPFMRTFVAAVEKAYKLKTGVELDLPSKVFEHVTGLYGLKQIAEFMIWGASRFSPVDLTDLGNDPSGLEYVLRSGDPTELIAVRGTARRLTEGARRLARGEPRAAEYLAPTAVRGFMKMYREMKGEPTLLSKSENPQRLPLLPGKTEEESQKLTAIETMLTGLGFPLTRTTKAYEDIRRIYGVAHGAAELKDSVIKEAVRTINRTGVTEDQINASIDKVLAFNEVFPEQVITQEGISKRITNRNLAPWTRIIQQTPEPARLGVMKILRPDLFEGK